MAGKNIIYQKINKQTIFVYDPSYLKTTKVRWFTWSVVNLTCKEKLRGFPHDKNSNRRKVLIREFHKKMLKAIHEKVNLIHKSRFTDCYFKPCILRSMSKIWLLQFNQILTYKKHFNRYNMHTVFTSSNSKFLRNNQFFYKGLIRKSALFPWFKKATIFAAWHKAKQKNYGCFD